MKTKEKTKEVGQGFVFQEAGHKYFLDGKPMTGVTTVLSVIAKPALIQWAANEAVKYVMEKWGNGLSRNDLMVVLDEAKTAHRKKKEDAGSKGTDVHAEIEKIIKTAMETGMLPTKYENPQVQHFLDWANKNNVKFLASEEKVFSRELFVAGTIDFICEIDGEVWLGDIKTASGIYPEFFFQTAGYQKLMTDMVLSGDGGMPVNIKGHIITLLRKDGGFEEKRSISNEDNLLAFMSALNLYRVTEKLKGTL